MKNLYIIAGCNGAGKTTASYTVLPEMLGCREFVNADEIARGLSPFNPESVALQAGRLMIERVMHLMKEGQDFAFETTLATRSYVKLIKKAQSVGYFVSLIFFSLPTPEQAVQRVARRVSQGGHNIPTDVIYRRYDAGLRNFFQLYSPLVDFWSLYDNNICPTFRIASGWRQSEKMDVVDAQRYYEMQQAYSQPATNEKKDSANE
ncbi:MAG: zeta toxin family protein [Bacteroidaceae bacterium]|nr:zeta toxin family protein [Bacteroidaceae bacterium]MBR1467882.1 zeta toxin family protein [Bacteroidaceae bacterium]